MSLQDRIRKKNEATGMRVVGQYVQEFWECGWQPFESRNDQGIDGLIILKRKGVDLGVKINVQVKCGAKYISSINDRDIKLSIDDALGLKKHLEYWRNQLEPSILIFVNPSKIKRDKSGKECKDSNGKTIWIESRINSQAWWIDLKRLDLQPQNTKSIISISKINRFGEHSKGDFLKLVQPLLNNIDIPKIRPNKESLRLIFSENLKKDAREFYKTWNTSNCIALDQSLKVSRTGWRHIVLSRRGKERRINSLRLLGIAKQIIEEIPKYFLLTQKEDFLYVEQKLGIRAIIDSPNLSKSLVQVIILKRINKLNKSSKFWFYSVHYRR
jgi:hypothetical protein